jgi:chromosome segregation ATPase
METQSALDQSIRIVESSLHKIGEEIKIGFDQRKQEMESSLQLIKEGEISNIANLIHETKSNIDELKAGIDGLREEIKKLAEEMVALNQKIKEGFVEVREELGSMMKFSYADLEKKFNALETRIKALEKMVFP